MNIFLPIQVTSTTYYIHMYIRPEFPYLTPFPWSDCLANLGSDDQ